jgi:amino acid adenylation domain-containing protein
MKARLVQDLLEASARTKPDKVALVCDGQRLTYAEINRRADRLAQTLTRRGIRRGDRVVLHLPNSVELVVAIFGVLKAGAVFVAVNATTKAEKVAFILEDCAATALIAATADGDGLAAFQTRAPSLQLIALTGAVPDGVGSNLVAFQTLLDEAPDGTPERVNIDLDLACLIYTSGSTGDPKGVMSDHSNVVFAVEAITGYLENREDDILLNVLPLSFDYGLYQLLMAFSFGGRLVLERRFAYPADVLQRIEQERVTGLPGVPTLFSVLLEMDLSSFDLSSLRYLTNTAASLPPAHILKLKERFPWVRLFSMYGLTETKRTLYLPPDELERRPDSVGIAIPGTEVWLEDDAGRRLGPGEVGELVVRGRHVMRGYWGDAAATGRRFRPGPIPGERLCYTGDLFRRDEAGFYYFVARQDDIIKSRGEKVAPKEIENVLYRLDGVQQAAVIGVPDPVLGQAIKAFIVANGSGLSAADVLRHCRAHLEDFMVPRSVEFRDDLPKTASGKIRRAELA